MADDLLEYYNRELTFIRRLGAEFAAAHPKIARRLRLSPDEAADDPHVERLIEAFAYLTARIRTKLEDEFPELTDVAAQRPLPALPGTDSLALRSRSSRWISSRFSSRPATRSHATPSWRAEPIQEEAVPVSDLLPGHALADRGPVGRPGAGAVARSGYALLQRGVRGAPARAQLPRRRRSASRLWGLTSLRFFLKGQSHHVHRLYELLFNHTIGVAVTHSGSAGRTFASGAPILSVRSDSTARKDCCPIRPDRFSATGS